MLLIPLVLRGPIHIYTFDPFLLALYLLWIIRIAVRSNAFSLEINQLSQPKRIHVVDGLLFLLLLWCLISALFAVEPSVAMLYWLQLLRGVLFYIYIRHNLGTVIRMVDLRYIIYLTLFVECTIAVSQFATGTRIGSVNDYFGDTEEYANAYFYTSIGRVLRVVGTFHNPNILADWIVLLGPFVYSWIYFRTFQRRLPEYFLLFITLWALIFTFSRSGWISLTVGAIAFTMRVLLTNKKNATRVMYRLFGYVITIILICLIVYVISLYSFENFSIQVLYDRFSNVSGGGRWRWGYIDLTFQLLQRYPITGVGLGNFAAAIQADRALLQMPAVLMNSERFSTVHNLYLQIFAETGIVGGVIWGVLCIYITVSAWKICSTCVRTNKYMQAISLGLFAAWLAFAFNVNFEAVFFHPSILMLVFALWGLITALPKQCRYLKMSQVTTIAAKDI